MVVSLLHRILGRFLLLISWDHWLWRHFFSSLLLWNSICLCYWGMFLVCRKMLDPACVSRLLAYVFLLENWVCWYWEIRQIMLSSSYVYCCRWHYVYVFFSFCFVVTWLISCFLFVCLFVCFWYWYLPCFGICLPESSVGLDW